MNRTLSPCIMLHNGRRNFDLYERTTAETKSGVKFGAPQKTSSGQ